MKYSWLEIKNHLKTRDWKWLTKIICIFAIVILVVTDQIIKLAVQKDLVLNNEYKFLPGFINLKYIKNNGSAFGLFPNQFYFLVIFALLMIVGGIVWLLFTKSIIRSLGLSFVIAGTIGNVIDRFLHNGEVIDFLHLQFFPFQKTIFNIADTFIITGVIIIISQIIIETIISNYQEKNGAQNNETTFSKFKIVRATTIKQNKTNIHSSTTSANRQIFSNSISKLSLFT